MPAITQAHIEIDVKLLEKARQLGGFRRNADAATQALKEFIQRRKQIKLLDLFGTIEYEEGLEPKALRRFAPAIPQNKYNAP
jgi:hypothetical protein